MLTFLVMSLGLKVNMSQLDRERLMFCSVSMLPRGDHGGD